MTTALNPSQVRYPWKAVIRTLVQVILTAVSVVPWIVSAVNDAADGTSFAGQLSAAGVQALAVAGVITRLMAIPTVNEALTKWGLGARPANAPAVVLQDPEIAVAAPDLAPAPYGRHAAAEAPEGLL